MRSPRTVFILCAGISLLMSCSVNTVVNTGLDNARNEGFPMFAGKSVGVVTNHTAIDRNGDHLVDLLDAEETVEVKAIFAPEHGFRGDTEAGVHLEDNTDPGTGAVIYSIYGSTRKPTSGMLEGVDALLFDIQDIGARFYTYISTMGNIMEAAGEHGIPVYIMDRPNPVGRLAEGPVLQQDYKSFIGMYPIPIRHGMTVGELALMIRDNGWVDHTDALELHVVEASGWDPQKSYEATGLTWVDPSPNMRNVNEALVYPGMCLFEGTNFNEGRGTEHPFEWVGAAYIDGETLLEELRKRDIPGVDLETVTFVPVDMPGYAMNPKFEGETCEGIAMTVTDPASFKAVELGVHMLDLLRTLYPEEFEIRERRFNITWGNDVAYTMLMDGRDAEAIIGSYQQELSRFLKMREKYLLY